MFAKKIMASDFHHAVYFFFAMTGIGLPHRMLEYFILILCNQFNQNACNIQFIKSFYVKCVIYKPWKEKSYI